MPRKAEERLAEYARMWAERGIRSWGEGWWDDADDGRRPGRPDRRRACRLDGDAPERRGRRGGRALLLPPGRPAPQPRRLRARATSRRCATSTRRSPTSRSSSARTTRRSSTRSTSARCSSRSATCSSRPARSRTSSRSSAAPTRSGAHVILDCYQSAGIVPFDVTALGVDFAVGGSVKWLCGGPGNGWLYVRPDLAERLDADVHRLAGARAAVRLRGGDGLRDRRGALPHRHAERARALRRDRGLRPDRGDRRRAHPRRTRSARRSC